MAGWCGWTADRWPESEQVVRLILMAVAILTNGCLKYQYIYESFCNQLNLTLLSFS